jgi:hypothetical protein
LTASDDKAILRLSLLASDQMKLQRFRRQDVQDCYANPDAVMPGKPGRRWFTKRLRTGRTIAVCVVKDNRRREGDAALDVRERPDV